MRVRVEAVPWSEGKRRMTISFEWFLAAWSERLSWTEVAQIFATSWETVVRSVERVVEWGRSHADYSGIEAIGIDEIQWRYGQTYLTFVDMWKAYLSVIRKRAAQCLHVLDRFHIIAHLSEAIDKVRASEARALSQRGRGQLLKHSRWAILRRPENRTEKDELKLADIVLAHDLMS